MQPAQRSRNRTASLARLRQHLGREGREREDGAALVEGALVFGIFMSIVLALIEFGIFFMHWSTGRNASSEGAHELAIAGRSSTADYSGIRAVKKQLNTLGGKIDYMIVYRAKNIKDSVPAQCLTAAEAGKSGTDAQAPHGVFVAPDGSPTPETFDWVNKRATIACNIYYQRNVDLVPASMGAFIYDRNTVNTNPSLDRYWPGGFRTDWMNGPVDYVGFYMQTTYESVTGIIPTRKVKHNTIIQIEPRRAN
jgi:Flp pilus assembly protein TadG